MIFAEIVAARDAEGAAWLRDAAPNLPLLVAFARCSRKLGDAVVEPSEQERTGLAEHAPGDAIVAVGWRLRDLGRAELIHRAMQERDAAQRVELYGMLLRRGEQGEQESLLRLVALLPERERFSDLAVDACRTNSTDVFAAIACENPYPAACFPDLNFNQMVLKAVFIGLDVKRIHDLPARVTPELVRMAQGYASERPRRGAQRSRGHRPHRAPFGDETMKLFDPHIHMTSRTTDDYQAMADHGIAAIVEPAFWVGQPRTHVGTFEDYFLSLLGWERFRASQFGIRHFCTMALNPKEANNEDVAPGVIELVQLYLEKEGVVAVGEIGYDDMTAAEEKYFAAQLQLAIDYELPALIHTPHRDKKKGTLRTLDLVKEVGIKPEMTLVDHNTEETLPAVLDSGVWAGHSIYPATKMDEHRMVALVQKFGGERIIINSAADWGVSDPLKVPKTVAAMREAGIPDDVITQIAWNNPVRYFAQSGKLDLEEVEVRPKVDQTRLWEGNSVLRGQKPVVE